MTESRPEQFFQEIATRLDAKQPFALATVVHTSGSTPQKAGARAIFLPDGRVLGTLGGGCMEAEARRRALELIGSGELTTETRRHGGPTELKSQMDADTRRWDRSSRPTGWNSRVTSAVRIRVRLLSSAVPSVGPPCLRVSVLNSVGGSRSLRDLPRWSAER
jgi:xanthine/CO dehydrogenase XdhC/CoxF family maturation factor